MSRLHIHHIGGTILYQVVYGGDEETSVPNSLDIKTGKLNPAPKQLKLPEAVKKAEGHLLYKPKFVCMICKQNREATEWCKYILAKTFQFV